MKAKKLRALLDLVSGAAILVGLIFVGLELRQNTEAVQAASLQNQTDASTGFLLMIGADPELTRIWLAASTDLSQLNELDAQRFFFISRARWLRMQNAFLQWQRGTLIDEDWSFYDGLICRPGAGNVFRYSANWDTHKVALTDRFVEYVESCWSDSP